MNPCARGGTLHLLVRRDHVDEDVGGGFGDPPRDESVGRQMPSREADFDRRTFHLLARDTAATVHVEDNRDLGALERREPYEPLYEPVSPRAEISARQVIERRVEHVVSVDDVVRRLAHGLPSRGDGALAARLEEQQGGRHAHVQAV